MTDKELLELAAKAAGIELVWEEEDRWCYIPENVAPFNRRESDKFAGVIWDPLTDDGDALRLAVELEMGLWTKTIWGDVTVDCHRNKVNEKIVNDPYAATRRAIVRAAAEIGGNV